MLKKNRFAKYYLFLFFLFASGSMIAQTVPAGFTITNIASGWNQPTGSTFNNAGTKLFVWEKRGRVYVCNWDNTNQVYVKQSTPVVDIGPEVGNWRDHGLLGFALDPNFDVNGLIYLMYVVDRHYLLNFGTGSYNSNSNNYNSATIGRITRYQTTVSAGNLVVIPASRSIILGESKTTGIPILYESHGVGSLVFAPDGTLLASTGDAASFINADLGSQPETYYVQALADGIIRTNENVGAFRSQMLNSLDGKILRIDPATGDGISSNPFYIPGSPRAAQSRVWALGLRNPFRMSLKPNTGSANPATGDIGEIFVSEVGLGLFEELNIIKSPATNCGWPLYEGITPLADYFPVVYNKDEPNPLYGIGGCTQQYFSFQNLLKQATFDNNHTVYNPCNPAVPITGYNDERYYHRMPALDWKHLVDSARVPVFINNNLTVQMIGSPASGVSGTTFNGNTAIAGTFYTGTTFPPVYQDSYFFADYSQNWMRHMKVQYTDQVQRVDTFETGFTSIVHITQNPLDGSLVVTDIGEQRVSRIAYGGNQPPYVKMSADKYYGPGPLLVNFTGNTSYDTDGSISTYNWDFGDGGPGSTLPNPSHVFSSGNSLPIQFNVKLTVKDNQNTTSVDSVVISLNNTPPNVAITSPVNNSTYTLGVDTFYTLQATVTDLEHTPANLNYEWQTILRHNTHQHPGPVDTAKVTSEDISRIGCNGDNYYWFIRLTVTDGAGLSTTDSSKLFPYCGGPLPLKLTSFSVTGRQNVNLLKWTTEQEINIWGFDIERSYTGSGFEKIGSVRALPGSGMNAYEFRDEHFLDGYVYYRLKILDKDGKFTYSLIVRSFNGNTSDPGLTVSPNPFTSGFLFAAGFKKDGTATFRIIDSKGAVVRELKKKVDNGFNSFQIDKLETLGKGVYYLEVIQGTELRRTKLIRGN